MRHPKHPIPRTLVVILDAKHRRCSKKPFTLYVAQDAGTGHPLCWILLPRRETRQGYDHLLVFLKKHTVLKGIVSDWHRSIRASVHDHAPRVPHQRCAAHVLQEAGRKLGTYAFRTSRGREFWKIIRYVGLQCQTLQEAEQGQRKIERQLSLFSDREQKALHIVFEALPDIYVFMAHPRSIPRTSNRIENLMGQLEARLKTFRGSVHPEKTLSVCTEILNGR